MTARDTQGEIALRVGDMGRKEKCSMSTSSVAPLATSKMETKPFPPHPSQ